MPLIDSKGVRLAGAILTLIGTLIVLYDMFLAEEKKGLFESLGFFVFAIGLFVSGISSGWGKKKNGGNP